VNWFRIGGLSACVCCFFPSGLMDCGGQTNVLRFETLAQPGTSLSYWGQFYGENGFTLACVNGTFGFAAYQTNSPYFGGSTALFNDSSSDYTSLAPTDGGLFDFISVDLSKLQYSWTGPINFVGYRGTAQVVSVTLNFDPDAGIQRFIATNFVRLSEVRWPAVIPHQFDNVTVCARPGVVPTPQFQVVQSDCIVMLRGSYLRLGQSYSVQKSTDARTWTNAGSIIASSTIRDWAEMNVPQQTNAFYRLRWTQ
jgi:hypothetical protein